MSPVVKDEYTRSRGAKEPTPPEALGNMSDNIYESAVICRRLFEDYLYQRRIYNDAMAMLQRRFLTWAGFLGVFAPVHVSLDSRLSRAPEMKDLVISMLEILRRSIERGLARHGPAEQVIPGSPAEDGAMIGIHGSIDRLSRLALIIREPAKPADMEKILQHKRSRGSDFFGEVVLALLKNRFPPHVMTESLLVHLASSVVYRRDRLIYQYRREAKFSAHRNDDTVSETDFSKMSIREVGSVLGDLNRPQERQNQAQGPVLPHPLLNKAKGEASTTESKSTNTMIHNNSVSESSSACSNNPWIAGEYPKAPEDGKCTYCGKLLQEDVYKDEKQWRKHLKQDLKPYVCMSEECGKFPPAFESQYLWHNHMSSQHSKNWIDSIPRTQKWVCSEEHDATYKFDRKEDLLDHFETCHQKNPIDKASKRDAETHLMPDSLNTKTCPFCGEYPRLDPESGAVVYQATHQTPWSGRLRSMEQVIIDPCNELTLPLYDNRLKAASIILSKHVAYHLKYIAFWSLRWWDDDSGVSADQDEHPNSSDGKATASHSTRSLADEDISSLQSQCPKVIEHSDISNNFVGNTRVYSQYFLPIGIIRELVQHSNVELTLSSSGLFQDERIPQLVDYIVTTSKRLFLTLICCEDIKPIENFLKAGLTDEDLPLCTCSKGGRNVHKCGIDGSHGVQDNLRDYFDKWGDARMDLFIRLQWIFLAPVFTPTRFVYLLHDDCPLPYVHLDSTSIVSHFSSVERRGIHVDHLEGRHHSDVLNGNYVDIAVKQWINNYSTDGKELYDKEIDAPKIMRHLDHNHLIQAIAFYRKGPNNCLVFPWARGGDLANFWRTDASNLDEDLVEWALAQIEGICHGIMSLHDESMRHGYLKPEKILHFPQKSGGHGLLKVAGPRIVNLHAKYTRDQALATRKDFDYWLYLPPEVDYDRMVSLKADVWSLGCIFLEFVIWLVYGQGHLSKFHQHLKVDPEMDRFWSDSLSGPKKHPAVQYWIHQKLEKDLKVHTALWDLVELIDERLLVTSSDERGHAGEVNRNLKLIRKKCSENPTYRFDSRLASLAASRTLNPDKDSEIVRQIDQHYATFSTRAQSPAQALFNTSFLGHSTGSDNEEEKKRQLSRRWFKEYNRLKAILQPENDETVGGYARVKVAVLDTGINSDDHQFALQGGYERYIDFSGADPYDETRQGTVAASLILRMCPNAILYGARISKTKSLTHTEVENVVRAIGWAVDQGVNIITLPLGFNNYHFEIENEIARSRADGILIFSGASSSQTSGIVSFPARDYHHVFGIFSTNAGNHESSDFNPIPGSRPHSLAIFGEGVEIAEDGPLLNGTSYSASIAAGLAAILLDFLRQEKHKRNLPDISRLEDMRVMMKLFLDMSCESSDGKYKCIQPWNLLNREEGMHRAKQREWIRGTIERLSSNI
ncbi:serine/threonine protein kinase [Fusarium oxysporum f. sp. lycopersici MN25]|nr:serine/threonine protein kinase [Fusarium oxysporum f. sp. lycopersici MN25]